MPHDTLDRPILIVDAGVGLKGGLSLGLIRGSYEVRRSLLDLAVDEQVRLTGGVGPVTVRSTMDMETGTTTYDLGMGLSTPSSALATVGFFVGVRLNDGRILVVGSVSGASYPASLDPLGPSAYASVVVDPAEVVDAAVEQVDEGFISALYRAYGPSAWAGLDAIFGPKCFPAGTEIQLAAGQRRPIETIQPGDVVTSFDGAAFGGRSGLVEKRVTRTFENITDTWVKLRWQEGGEARELTVTPGHHFLDSRGGFRPIDAILADDGVIVLEDGSLSKVAGEYIHYSADTADMFEQAEGYVTPTVGSLALAPVFKKGWKTYNFEVEDLHTYVAGGVRVHNESVFIGTGKDVPVGARFEAGDYAYRVQADGSITNTDTAQTANATA